MTSAIILLNDPESAAMDFARRLAQEFPDLHVDAIDDVVGQADMIGEADVIVTLGAHLGARAALVFEAAKALDWVQLIGTGTDNIAVHLGGRDIAVTNVRGIHGAQMSEAALAAMLSLARDMPRLLRNQAARRWERFPARLLSGKTVGIVGLGAIAAELAPRCKALGMTVVGISAGARAMPGFDRIADRKDLAEAVADIDYLVLLTPYSPETHHLIDARILGAMKPDACLVNVARGGVTDETALLAALRAGTIGGAALDVFADEPLPADNAFWGLDNVIVTPHVGGFHDGYADDVFAIVAENFRRYLAGGTAALLHRT